MAKNHNPPNIILLMPDQLRTDFLGCFGASWMKTPNIDRLASKGVLYRNVVSPSPICIPARASFLTGHNALSTGVLSNNYWLRPDHDICGQRSLAKMLSEEGYRTEAIGKMHFIPWDHDEGFHHRVIAEDKRHIHIQDDYAIYLKEHGLRKLSGPVEPGYREGRMASISPIPMEHQVDAWIGKKAVEFLENYSHSNPFFLWLGFAGPHDPYNPPQEIADQVRDLNVPEASPATKETNVFRDSFIKSHQEGSAQTDFTHFPKTAKDQIRRHYAGLIQIIDQQVGKILEVMETRSPHRETVVLFTSDHGDFLGDFDFVGKALFHEPSIRIPLIASGGPFHQGQSKSLVSLTDLYSSILALAGSKNAVSQDSIPLPEIEQHITRNSVLGSTGSGVMILKDDWKLCKYKNGVTTLHHILQDRLEQNNLHQNPDFQDIYIELEQRLMSEVLQSVIDGHSEKTYPYMTMTSDHPGHQPGWIRPYPNNIWSEKRTGIEGWAKSGMPT